jgi:hypothetical protein
VNRTIRGCRLIRSTLRSLCTCITKSPNLTACSIISRRHSSPGARVGIVDAIGPTSEHGTPPSLLRCELAAVGYREIAFHPLTGGNAYLVTNEDFLQPVQGKLCADAAFGAFHSCRLQHSVVNGLLAPVDSRVGACPCRQTGSTSPGHAPAKTLPAPAQP